MRQPLSGRASSRSWFWDKDSNISSLVERRSQKSPVGEKQINEECISNSDTTVGNWSSVPWRDNVKQTTLGQRDWRIYSPVSLPFFFIWGLLPGKIILGHFQLVRHSAQTHLTRKENSLKQRAVMFLVGSLSCVAVEAEVVQAGHQLCPLSHPQTVRWVLGAEAIGVSFVCLPQSPNTGNRLIVVQWMNTLSQGY